MRRLAALTVLLVALAGCKGATPDQGSARRPLEVRQPSPCASPAPVTDAVAVLGVGAYKVKDDTGTITVVSKTTGVPREGAKVGVEGTVQTGYTIGTQSLTVLVESKRQTE
jgi:hypothetical protein